MHRQVHERIEQCSKKKNAAIVTVEIEQYCCDYNAVIWLRKHLKQRQYQHET